MPSSWYEVQKEDEEEEKEGEHVEHKRIFLFFTLTNHKYLKITTTNQENNHHVEHERNQINVIVSSSSSPSSFCDLPKQKYFDQSRILQNNHHQSYSTVTKGKVKLLVTPKF